MNRVALYIDGFNFYYSVRNHFNQDRDRRGYSMSGLCWCDFRALIERSGWLQPGEHLDFIKYFTAPVTPQVDNPLREGEPERQRIWLNAVRTIPGLQVVEGYYHRDDKGERLRQEKQTDVNIAVELMLDALAHRYDRGILLSGDQDLIPAVAAVVERLSPPRAITLLLPPGQSRESWGKRLVEHTRQLKQRGVVREGAQHAPLAIVEANEEKLANSLLPYEMTGADGFTLHCPPYWRLPAHYLEKHCRPVLRPDAKPVLRTARG